MRNNKGITLIALVIMIIIILILASVGTTTGLDVIRQSKYNRAVAEMKVMQIKVNEMYEEYKSGDLILDNIGTDIPSSLQTKSETALTAIYGNLSNINTSDFKYYSADYIKNTLDVDGVENDYLLNIKTREVVLIDGTKNDGEMYYSLSQIDDEQFNVEYINPGIIYSPDGGMYILPKNITSENNLNMNIALSLQDIPNNMSSNDLTIKYAWSTSKDTEPSEWIQLPDGTTTITEDENSDITEAGEYYLWTKIEDNNGKALNTIVSKKFTVKGEYDLKVAVTFDANGGTVDIQNKNYINNEAYGELPTPTREGYTFNGWSTSGTDETIVDTNSIVNAESSQPSQPQSQTLYANWDANIYNVTFDPTGGSVATTSKQVTYHSTYGELPIPTREGYTFSGWRGKNMFDEQTLLGAISGVNYVDNHYVFTFRNAYNKYSNGKYLPIYGFKENTQYSYTIQGYVTASHLSFYFFYSDGTSSYGWFGKTEEGTSVITSTKGKTLKFVTMTYGANNTAYISHIQLEEGATSTGFEPYTITTSDTNVTKTSDHTLYAEWQANSYDVTFNANGGNVGTLSKSVKYGVKYGTLPTPTRAGYIFKGWTLDNNPGDNPTYIVANSFVNTSSNHTLYAQWEETTLESNTTETTPTNNSTSTTSSVIGNQSTLLSGMQAIAKAKKGTTIIFGILIFILSGIIIWRIKKLIKK